MKRPNIDKAAAPYRPSVTSDVVVDVSHWENVNIDFAAVARAGIVAAILKATQGTGFVDPTFLERAAAAKAAGLLVGAYHFLDGSDPAAQMTLFLSVARGMAGVGWLALDFEPYPPSTPSIPVAAGAASILHTRVGRYPVLYTLRGMLPTPSPMLSNCALWLAEYGTNPIPPAGFNKWEMHQYTDGVAGPNPRPVPGIGVCDRSVFAGTVQDLRAWWRNPVKL